MKKLVFAAAALLVLTPGAWAGAYVGASVGQTDTSFDSGSSNFDVGETSWKIVGGYTFMKFVGVEASYRDFGSMSDTQGTFTFDGDASSIDVFGVGMIPVGKVNIFGKVGYSRIDLDATIDDTANPNPQTFSASDEEFAYGAGVSFKLWKVDFRIEYEMFDTSDTLNMFSAGAIFKF